MSFDAPPSSLPPSLTQARLCLDGQLSARLMNHFRCSYADLPGGLRGALRLWQWERLCRTVLYAAGQSPHYKKHIGPQEARVRIRAAAQAAASAGGPALPENFIHDPAASRDLTRPLPGPFALERGVSALLALLPRTLPEDLAAAPESFLAVSQNEVSGLISLPTSGTTGPGKRIFCTESDLAETAAFFRHGMRYMVEPGTADKVALLMSGDRPGSVGHLLLTGMAELGVPCQVPGFMRPGPEGENTMLDTLLRLAPTCLVGVPGQMLALARHERAKALARHVRCVLLSGDAVTPALRGGIANGLACKVFVHYGLTETGLGGAVECRERKGPHIREADLLFEVLDEAGNPLPEGCWGELAVTTLTRQAMPLLRYRTGDQGRLIPGGCACGSVLGRIEVCGRLSRSVPLPSGGRLPLTVIDELLYTLPSVQEYRATLHQWEAGGETRQCLCLELRLAGGDKQNALVKAARALAALPELCLTGSVSAPCQGRLALRLKAADAAFPPSAQAKQNLHFSDQTPRT